MNGGCFFVNKKRKQSSVNVALASSYPQQSTLNALRLTVHDNLCFSRAFNHENYFNAMNCNIMYGVDDSPLRTGIKGSGHVM